MKLKIVSIFTLTLVSTTLHSMQPKRSINLTIDSSYFDSLQFKVKNQYPIAQQCSIQMGEFLAGKNSITTKEYENKFLEIYCNGLKNGLNAAIPVEIIASQIINITKNKKKLEEFFDGNSKAAPKESFQILSKIKKTLEDKNEQAAEIKRQCEQDYQNQLSNQLNLKDQEYNQSLKKEKFRFFGFGILFSFGLFGIHHYFSQWVS